MNVYFIILCVMFALSLGINLAKHGEPRKDSYNFLTTLIAGTIQIILIILAIKKGF